MAKLALLILLAVCVPTAFAAAPVTVAQAEQLLATLQGQPDGIAAAKISNLELTERATSARLARWQTQFPGQQSRDALLALADASAFLDLPHSDIPAIDKLGYLERQQILRKAQDYADQAISQLPSFSAQCTTTHFDDLPPGQQLLALSVESPFGSHPQPAPSGPPPLSLRGRSSIGITYRSGREAADSQMAGAGAPDSMATGLATWGEFGPVLASIVGDVAYNKTAWSHWEKGPTGPLAVFRYAVPEKKSHYSGQSPAGAGTPPIAYHGELAIDPADGSVLRLTLIPDTEAPTSGPQPAIAVEYALVTLENRAYICPARGILLRRPSPLAESSPQDDAEPTNSISAEAPSLHASTNPSQSAPLHIVLTDVAFSNYQPIGSGGPGQPIHVRLSQVEDLLKSAHGRPDRKVAAEIARLQLTERATSARLARWQSQFPAKHTRNALLALADASAFLNLPPEDISPIAMPDAATRHQILLRMVDYVNTTIHKLPDFYARRTTAHFDDISLTGDQLLHFVERNAIVVTYRNGHEVLNARSPAGTTPVQQTIGLTTEGEFGPILSIAVGDAIKGSIFWGRWEQGAAGPLAVFRYTVPQGLSHYTVNVSSGQPQTPAYHGEIAIDPATGTILRISVVADLLPPKGLEALGKAPEAAILVEYGPVVIGNGTYTCPLKGVGFFKLPNPRFITVKNSYNMGPERITIPSETFVNDVSFTQYHLFRTDVRILPSNSCGLESKGSPDCSN